MRNYSTTEKSIIKTNREIGYTYQVIADFLNKREHNGELVRTAEGVRKFSKTF